MWAILKQRAQKNVLQFSQHALSVYSLIKPTIDIYSWFLVMVLDYF